MFNFSFSTMLLIILWKLHWSQLKESYKPVTALKEPGDLAYRTLHFYNLIWAVCHLFPQQRWRTFTYSVSGNHWPGEPRDLRKTTSARKFRPAFGATSKTRIFYKYVVFKHSSSLFTQFLRSGNTLPPVWLNRRQIATTWIGLLADIQNIHWLWDAFQSQKTDNFQP